jgi:hypothetical protein
MAKTNFVENQARDQSLPISVGFDTSELEKIQKAFPHMAKAVRQAYIKALTRASKSGEVFAARRYRESYPSVPMRLLREKYIWSRISTKGENLNEIGGVLQIKGSGILLEYFKPKKTQRGVTWFSGFGPTREIRRSFYANVFKKSNKKEHWFRRTDKAVETGKRFPVEFLFGPSPYSVFKYEEPREAMKNHIQDRILTEVQQGLGFYMEKAVKDALKGIANG